MEKYITIDTSQMANKMDSVSHNVMATTAAVGVMQTAVINEEKVSSEKICGRLNYGFFNLITAQIEQKVANESSNANALAIELMQQQKALRSLQDRMGKDYNLIASRYVKLFNSLNKELKNRVVELDRPVMELCEQRIKQLQNRICALISSVPVYQSESLTAAQAIAAAHIKRNAQELKRGTCPDRAHQARRPPGGSSDIFPPDSHFRRMRRGQQPGAKGAWQQRDERTVGRKSVDVGDHGRAPGWRQAAMARCRRADLRDCRQQFRRHG